MENQPSDSKTWLMVLEFLCLKLLEKEIYEDWAKTVDFWGHDVKPDEIVVPIELEDWEKKLFFITDVIHRHIDFKKAKVVLGLRGKNDPKMFNRDFMSVVELEQIGHVFRTLFWSLLKLKCPELSEYNIGVRNGFKVVRDKEKVDIQMVPVGASELFQSLKDKLPGELREALERFAETCTGKKCESCMANENCPIRN